MSRDDDPLLTSFHPSPRLDDGRGCPGPGLAKLPRVRDASPEERLEKARRTTIPFGKYRGQPLDAIARSDEGLLFLDHVRCVSIPRNDRLKALWQPLRDFLASPPVADALQLAKDRARYKLSNR
jgi:hypothetical protein